MGRKFQIDFKSSIPMREWLVYQTNLREQEVEAHCRSNESGWKDGKYRLMELKPIEVKFEVVTTVKFKAEEVI